jgi:hypothetical protein
MQVNTSKRIKGTLAIAAISFAQLLITSKASAEYILSYSASLVSNRGTQCPYGFSPVNNNGYCGRNPGNREGYIMTIESDNKCPYNTGTTYAGGGYCMTTVNMRPPSEIANDNSGGSSTALSNALDMWADAFGGGKSKPTGSDSSLASLMQTRNMSVFEGYSIDPKYTRFGSDASIFDVFSFHTQTIQRKEKLIPYLTTRLFDNGSSIPAEIPLYAYTMRIHAPSGRDYDFAGVCYPTTSKKGSDTVTYRGTDLQWIFLGDSKDANSNLPEFVKSLKYKFLYEATSDESKCKSDPFMSPQDIQRQDEYLRYLLS